MKINHNEKYLSASIANTELHAGGLFFCIIYKNCLEFKDNGKVILTSKKQEIFDKIWNNDGFRTDLFGPIAEDLLESMYDAKLTAFEILISEKSSNFYSFIKVN